MTTVPLSDEHGTVDMMYRSDEEYLHIEGIKNTGFDSYKSSGPRNGDPAEQQVADTVRAWFEEHKM